ncbi:MAG: hypothetical protein IJ751_10150 [Oscillospiraceae bacterium]|nr:hypothetical protein [Oscillospiraceae bacterium]
MRVTYLEGESRYLAEADELCAHGATLAVHLTSGKTILRNFPSEELLTAFFEEVLAAPGDRPILLENTNLSMTLGAMLDELDELYDD